MNEIIRSGAATIRVAESQGGVMEGSLDMQAEDSETSNLIREGEQGEVETAEGMGTMPCQNTVADATTGGTSTMNTDEQVFLRNVLRILRFAHEYLPNKWNDSRHKLQFFNEITEAWEDLTGEEFAPELVLGEEEDVEEGKEEVS
jgi:hypothetical protein